MKRISGRRLLKTYIQSGLFVLFEARDQSHSDLIIESVAKDAGPNDYIEPDLESVKIRDFIVQRNRSLNNGGFVVATVRPGADVSALIVGLNESEFSFVRIDLTPSDIVTH